jgi:hypothetical protein
VPVDERTRRSGERCDQHPTRSAVARCGGCGRPLCLTCAIPVRGRVLGTECLPDPLGRHTPVPARRGPPLTGADLVAGVGFGLALLATALPWSRFGVGAGPFGAWGGTPRWSLLAAISALAGTAVWVARLGSRGGDRRAFDAVLAVLGALVALGSALAIWHPPAFTRVWVGPWVGLLGGLAGCAASLAAVRREREPSTAPV